MTKLSYWERRYLQTKAKEIRSTEAYEKGLQPELNGLFRELNGEVSKWVDKYAKNQGIDSDAARKALDGIHTKHWQMTLKRFREKAKAGGYEDELDAEYFRSRVARLQALEQQLRSISQPRAQSLTDSMRDKLADQYDDTYMRTNYNLQAAHGRFTADFAHFNDVQLRIAVSQPWGKDGKDFSQRIWKNYQRELPSYLMDAVLRGTIMGCGPQKVTQMMHARFQDVKRNNVHRLVVSEMAHVAEEANVRAYEENEIEQYEYMATLESHTCDICAKLDGQIFKVSERRPGVNYPIIHGRCRCTTIPYLKDLPDIKERWSRDPVTGKGKMVKDVKFNEWKAHYLDPFEKQQRFNKLQDVMGEHAPSYKQFQEIAKGSLEEEQLNHALKTVSYIHKSTRETESLKRREMAEEVYYSARDAGILLSGHAALQYAVRIYKKRDGQLLYNFETLKRVASLTDNYVDSKNGRHIRYYDKMALIKEVNSEEIVTIIRQRKKGKRWVEYEE